MVSCFHVGDSFVKVRGGLMGLDAASVANFLNVQITDLTQLVEYSFKREVINVKISVCSPKVVLEANMTQIFQLAPSFYFIPKNE